MQMAFIIYIYIYLLKLYINECNIHASQFIRSILFAAT